MKTKTFLKKTSFERFRMINWSILGHLCFTAGNILWIVSPAMCWVIGTPSVCFDVEVAAAVCFVFDGTFQLVEFWCLDYEHRLVGGYLHIYGGGIGSSPFRKKLESVNWLLLTHLFFFYGALGDVATGSIDTWTDTPDTTWWSMWSDFIASSLWFLSSVFSIILWYLDTSAREHYQARIQQKMFPSLCQSHVADFEPTDTERNSENYVKSNLPRRVVWFSVTGWSVWLYALASLIYAAGSFACYFYTNGYCWLTELVAACVFFLQGILDMIEFYRRRYYEELDMADEQDSINVFMENNNIVMPINIGHQPYDSGSHGSGSLETFTGSGSFETLISTSLNIND
eukprot:TRINITY_DN6887_c0_g1_i1.p1 TRINITY_DN6887_c0_g1~~TRINITY_DN6887_c0_g1_i1.p1  ORF type:complete len:342 (-),score=37.52 TRINITY_DN6887_c0_g1_i1:41-1066(-)